MSPVFPHDVRVDRVAVSNVAEQLIEKGFASVVRHKRDDEDRSPDYDKFMAAEQT
jgi:staphylococcal nuclease domain-containing protein 1